MGSLAATIFSHVVTVMYFLVLYIMNHIDPPKIITTLLAFTVILIGLLLWVKVFEITYKYIIKEVADV